jgi:hypothetical protein
MKVVVLFLLVLTTLLPHGTWAQSTTALPSACVTVRKAYAALHQQATRQTEQAFLQAFPATYASFTAVFGYRGRDSRTTSIQFGCLYDTSPAYVEQLFALHQVPRTDVFAKLVGIARQAHWQSDGLNYLQHYSIALATKDAAFLTFLNAQPAADIHSFTRFLLLNPVSNEPLKKQLKAAYAHYSHLRKVV